jgi:hypothetical protein
MNLNILILQESEATNISKDKVTFRWLTHHVSEIYIYLLPKINVNNSSKIVIEFGPPGIHQYVIDSILGCSNIFVMDFDFEKFYSLSSAERDLMLINEIKKGLVSIYRRRDNKEEDIQTIISTADKAISIGFSLDIPVKKLQKTTKDKKWKIEIHRILNANVGEAWKCIVINKKDSSLLMEKWITKVPGYLDRTDFFKKAEIQEDTYIIYDNLGNITFQMNLLD